MSDRRSNRPAAGLRPEYHQSSVKSLKDNLLGLDAQYILGALPPKLRKRVVSLRAIQSQRDELEAKLSEEKAALEAKYQKLYEPLYKRRSEIVTGVVEVDGVTKDAKATTEKGVPNFWLSAMKSEAILAEVINPRDELALKYLKDIKWCRNDNPKGFKMDFFFNPNPYFKNTILTKTYHMIDEEKAIIEDAFGTNIEWFQGNCLMEKKPRVVPRYFNPFTKTESWESFFRFFSPPVAPDNVYGLGMNDLDDLQTRMDQDYLITSIIKHKIIPRAVSWFTGEAAEDDVFGMKDNDCCNLGIKNYLFGKKDKKITWKDHKDKVHWIKRNKRTFRKYLLDSLNECEHHIGYDDYTRKYSAFNKAWEDDVFGMNDEDYSDLGLKDYLFGKNNNKTFPKYFLDSLNECEHHIGYDDYTCKYCAINNAWKEDVFGMNDEDYESDDDDVDYCDLGFKDYLFGNNYNKFTWKDHKNKVNLMKRSGRKMKQSGRKGKQEGSSVYETGPRSRWKDALNPTMEVLKPRKEVREKNGKQEVCYVYETKSRNRSKDRWNPPVDMLKPGKEVCESSDKISSRDEARWAWDICKALGFKASGSEDSILDRIEKLSAERNQQLVSDEDSEYYTETEEVSD